MVGMGVNQFASTKSLKFSWKQDEVQRQNERNNKN